jgi:hypothetical protein
MNSLISLWKKLAEELASMCCTSAKRDIQTVTLRTEHEGRSFLTITLPTFCKDFERSLDEGMVDPDMFLSFRKHAGLPRFLGGFLDQVFDRCTGRLLDEPSIDCIYAIRQLTLVFSKMFLLSSESRQKKAMQGFIDCEHDVKQISLGLEQQVLSEFKRVSVTLFREVFKTVDWKIYDLDLKGKHGPGATVDKLSGNEKFNCSTWTARLEAVLPFADLLLVNRSFRDIGDAIDVVEPEAETPVKVVSVPKTQKTPRIIAIEPTCMQFAQQAVSKVMIEALQNDFVLSRLIGFDDQDPNRDLAREGSRYGNLATLDLSEASDRVSLKLVETLVEDHPCLHRAVLACRSERANVPGHGIIPLSKYASMGTALTFPIEAMVFMTLACLGIEKELNRPFTRRDAKRLIGNARVFGDDIIVPKNYVRSVVTTLELFGLKVNVHKSFWTGKFRESCGKEFYDGHDVSVVKLRRELPTRRRHATEVIGLVSFRNQLYQRGLWKTCQSLDERIRAIIKHYPVVLPTSPVIGRHSFLGYETEKMCPNLHRPLVKGLVVSAQPPSSLLDGHGALFKVLNGDRREPFFDEKHLKRAGRPRSVNTKTRWAPPY